MKITACDGRDFGVTSRTNDGEFDFRLEDDGGEIYTTDEQVVDAKLHPLNMVFVRVGMFSAADIDAYFCRLAGFHVRRNRDDRRMFFAHVCIHYCILWRDVPIMPIPYLMIDDMMPTAYNKHIIIIAYSGKGFHVCSERRQNA